MSCIQKVNLSVCIVYQLPNILGFFKDHNHVFHKLVTISSGIYVLYDSNINLLLHGKHVYLIGISSNLVK